MSKLNRICVLLVAVAAAGVPVGCEWEGSGDSGTWNSAYNWVNFSGVYRAGSGGILVTDYSITGTPPNSPGSTNAVSSEGIGVGNGVNTTFSGTLNHSPVQAGSVSISAGGFDLVDDGIGGLAGSGVSGAIDYGTGGWSIDLFGIPLDVGVPITASYSYIVAGGTGGGTSSGAGSGSSGVTIFSFTVFQEGNVLSITDSSGAVYTGNMGSIRSTGGVVGSTDAPSADPNATDTPPTALATGDQVVGQFQVTGISGAGVQVTIVGTLQGVVGVSTGTGTSRQTFLTDRRMMGTWIEAGGVTGDIDGQASPISLSTSS